VAPSSLTKPAERWANFEVFQGASGHNHSADNAYAALARFEGAVEENVCFDEYVPVLYATNGSIY
jgi:hypothetical protein